MATEPLPLFVYGTLRRGHGNEFARLLHGASDFVSVGRVRGKLYRIAHYPGLVEASGADSDSWVAGEIWRPREDPDGLLKRLDDYEGEPYGRVQRPVETAAGRVDCWIYLYLESVAEKAEIISGDWLADV